MKISEQVITEKMDNEKRHRKLNSTEPKVRSSMDSVI